MIFAVIVAASALTQIAPQIVEVTKSSSAAEQLFRTIDRVPEIDSMCNEGKTPDQCIGEIEVRDVHFAYPARPHISVLKGLKLSVPTNKTTALVGASGSGKSTIVGLLDRWYDPANGSLLIDGIDIRDYNLQWLRTKVRIVAQEPVLFNGSVFDNVSFGLVGTGKASLSKSEKLELVKDACKAAYADEFIEHLPQGYDTQIGERAITLSGGQKQRLAIARSIVSSPQILLLDEATSALDPKAERIVQRALDNVSVNRTTIVIAHRLSTVRNADNIAVISNGAIIEQGTHNGLIAADGAYAALVRGQDLGQSGDASDLKDQDLEMAMPELQPTQTQGGPMIAEQDKSDKARGMTMNYTLARCLWIFLGEQKHIWYYFAAIVAACTVGGLTFPAQAIILSKTFNTFQIEDVPKRLHEADFWALMFFIIAIGNFGCYFCVGFFGNRIQQRVSRQYRLELFENVLKQDMEFFDRPENATGALAARTSTYPTNLQELLGFNIGLIVIQCVNLASSSILALIVGWKLGLVVVFGVLPVVVFCGWFKIQLQGQLDDQSSARFANSAAIAAEAVAAIRTVQSLTLETNILERYHDMLNGIEVQSTKTYIWMMFWYAITQSISFLGMALGFW